MFHGRDWPARRKIAIAVRTPAVHGTFTGARVQAETRSETHQAFRFRRLTSFDESLGGFRYGLAGGGGASPAGAGGGEAFSVTAARSAGSSVNVQSEIWKARFAIEALIGSSAIDDSTKA